jgi:Tol biopolymer transport system component
MMLSRSALLLFVATTVAACSDGYDPEKPPDTTTVVGSYFIMPIEASVMVGTSRELVAYRNEAYPVPVTEGITYRVVSGPLAVEGNRVFGTGIGVGIIEGRNGTFTDQTQVTVVPVGRLTGQEANRLYIMNSDGSAEYQIPVHTGDASYLGLALASDTMHVIYHDFGSADEEDIKIFIADTRTGISKRWLSPQYQQTFEEAPRRSWDKQWIYYGAGPDEDNIALYRARMDGSNAEKIGPVGGMLASQSPDGKSAAFIMHDHLALLDLASMAWRETNVDAVFPVWLPDGSGIVARSSIEMDLRLYRPDGTFVRTISSDRFTPNFDVTPDGKYIVATEQYGNRHVVLLDLTTGTRLNITSTLLSSALWGS